MNKNEQNQVGTDSKKPLELSPEQQFNAIVLITQGLLASGHYTMDHEEYGPDVKTFKIEGDPDAKDSWMSMGPHQWEFYATSRAFQIVAAIKDNINFDLLGAEKYHS